MHYLQVVAMVGECKCQSNKLTIRIERSGKYVVRGGRIKDKKIIHARVCVPVSIIHYYNQKILALWQITW